MLKRLDHHEIIKGFLPWVKNQTGKYDYQNPENCAFARYLRELGYSQALVGKTHFILGDGDMHELPVHIDNAVRYNLTFEALARALEAA